MCQPRAMYHNIFVADCDKVEQKQNMKWYFNMKLSYVDICLERVIMGARLFKVGLVVTLVTI